ncbi:MAG: hypothetical protein JNN07_26590 [Verrucomicrobiales bacterium]|nr:hypothetical protein [Verrucomicrobiales bacterium]
MSHWLSSKKAAWRAECIAQDTSQHRKDKRLSWLMIGGVTLASFGLMAADYFWLRYQARQRHEQRYHRGGKTNAPASAAPLDGQDQVTNHE